MSALHTRRILTVGVLLALLGVLCGWYGTFGVAAGLGAYPTKQVVGPTPEKYVGEAVTVTGTVVATDPVEISITYRGDQARTLVVTNLDSSAERGDELRVFGTLVDEDTVHVTNAFAVPQRGFVYTYAVSFLGGLWVLTRLLTQWRLDGGRLVRRTDSLTFDDLRTRLRFGHDTTRERRDDA